MKKIFGHTKYFVGQKYFMPEHSCVCACPVPERCHTRDVWPEQYHARAITRRELSAHMSTHIL